MPNSAQPLFEDPEVESTEDIYEALAAHLGWSKLHELQIALGRRGVRFALLSHYTADLSVAKAIHGPRDDTRFFMILGAKY